MKKYVKILIAGASTLFVLAGLSACSLFAAPDDGKDDDDFCEHQISQFEYDYDENYHWNRCYCEHKDTLRPNMVKHTIDATGKCYCGYRIECKAVFEGVGVGEIPSQTVRAGDFFKEPPAPERNGYVFDGWHYLYTDQDWALWDFEEKPAFKKDLELRAFWTKLYTYTYDTTGGEMPQGTDSVQVYRADSEIAEPVTPVREKYEFIGWSSDPDLFTAFDFENNKIARKDVTVYAFWEQLYYIDYHFMDESGTVKRNTVKAGARVHLQGLWMLSPLRDGYDLLGWTTVEGGTEVGTPDGDGEIYAHEDVQLYAVWIPAHKITYDGAGGLVQDINGYKFTDESYSYLVHQGKKPYKPQAKREGYTLLNWTDDPQTNVPFDFDRELESDTVLYAVWTYYTLTVRIDEGYERFADLQTPYDNTKVTAGTQVCAGLNVRGILGYDFIGWYDGGGQLVSEKTAYYFNMAANNVSLTAKWRMKAEMLNFGFTSDSRELCITSVKDKTVTEIVVPVYATEIAECAFYGCNSVQSMTVPFAAKRDDGGNTYRLERAFYDKPFDVTTMEAGTYYPATLTEIIFTGKKISKGAFSYFKTLANITFTEDLTEIPENAFYGCKKLTNITLPQGVTSIGARAFCDSGLTSIDLPANLATLGDEAFYNCDITNVVIHENVREIGQDCFTGIKLVNFEFTEQFTWTLTLNGESKKFVGLVDVNYASTYKKNQSYLWRRS